MDGGLPIVSAQVEYKGMKKIFKDLLIDTGSSSTILDTDLCEEIGLFLNFETAITRKMYGIGGSEICIEQRVSDMIIDQFLLHHFILQLGDVREMHGFDGIIGSDFFVENKLIIDFEKMEIRKN